jgi:hypothetical protein
MGLLGMCSRALLEMCSGALLGMLVGMCSRCLQRGTLPLGGGGRGCPNPEPWDIYRLGTMGPSAPLGQRRSKPAAGAAGSSVGGAGEGIAEPCVRSEGPSIIQIRPVRKL